MSTNQKLSVGASWKKRVAFVQSYNDLTLYLLIHPNGELLVCSDNRRHHGSARWDRACILWSEERQQYCMCKYGTHDIKFELEGLQESDLLKIANDFGIECRLNRPGNWTTGGVLDSLFGRHISSWSKKHPRMAKESPTLEFYIQTMIEADIEPIDNELYTGF